MMKWAALVLIGLITVGFIVEIPTIVVYGFGIAGSLGIVFGLGFAGAVWWFIVSTLWRKSISSARNFAA